MRKRTLALFLALFILAFSLISCKDFYGYSYGLEEARAESNFYKDADYTFSSTAEDLILDFVLKDQKLHILEIHHKDGKYKIKHTSSFVVDECIARFNKTEDYHWTQSSKLSLQKYAWCIVSKEFHLENGEFETFDFIYDEKSYVICYTITAKDE